MSYVKKYNMSDRKNEPLLIGTHPPVKNTILTKSQKKADELFREWFFNKETRKKRPVLRIGGGAGSGKAQPDDTLIPTPKGLKRLDKIKPGDKVFNLYGEPVEVLDVFPQGEKPCYEVTFNDGRITRCCDEHLWSILTSKGNLKTIQLSEMLNDYETHDKRGHARHKYQVPTNGIAQFKSKEVPIDPWLLGVFIGNGCLGEKALTISSGTPEVPRIISEKLGLPTYIREYDGCYNYRFSTGKLGKKSRSYLQTKEFFKDLPDFIGAKSGNEYIPDVYKYNSVEVRREILSGLLTTDGHISKEYKVSYTTTSMKLATDIVDLCRSLAYRATITKDKRVEKYRSGACYTIHINMPEDDKPYMFRCGKKHMKAIRGVEEGHKTASNLGFLTIVNIKRVDDCKQRCIYIDDPLHIYLTEHYIPTHNTFFVSYIIRKYGFNSSNCAVMAYTGQATNVLRSGGIMARTIHSTVMVPYEEPVVDKRTGKPAYHNGIPIIEVRFKPVKSLPKSLKLLIVDEASFLPKSLEAKLLKYNIPILEIGDPLQLPPVAEEQCFHMKNLDIFMEGTMRQDKDGELYDFITHIRKKQNIKLSNYHDNVLILRAQPTIEETFYRFLPFFKSADIVVTSTNMQRQIVTDRYRREILKAKSPYPIEGERLICRKNNYSLSIDQYNLVNGTQGICMTDVGRSMIDKSDNTFYMDFQPYTSADTDQYYDNLLCDGQFLTSTFGNKDNCMKGYRRYIGEKFEYAHAITTHLAQGAQYNTVLFMDSYHSDLEYLYRVRYTAASRAMQRLIYILPYNYSNPEFTDLCHIEEMWEKYQQTKLEAEV